MLCLLGGLAQINPIWVFGPFNPAEASGRLAARLVHGLARRRAAHHAGLGDPGFGFEIPNPFFPGVLLPTVTFGLLYLWPFLEARVTGDFAEHHIDDRPRQRPVRTALGAATLSFYSVLFFGAASDVIASQFGVSVNAVLWTFRVAVFVLPPVVAIFTYRLCKELCQRDGVPIESRVRFRDIGPRLLRRHSVAAGGSGRRRPRLSTPITIAPGTA